MCEHEAINGVTMDGGYAEYVLLRTEAVVKVPKDVDPVEYAPILCAGITVFNSIRKQNILLGELVAVQGLGGLGHLAIQCEFIVQLGIARGLLIHPLQMPIRWAIAL
jgi:D-arabinose 1-dehydrogenase-like Zn-dependent alcohol dehydrogenase